MDTEIIKYPNIFCFQDLRPVYTVRKIVSVHAYR